MFFFYAHFLDISFRKLTYGISGIWEIGFEIIVLGNQLLGKLNSEFRFRDISMKLSQSTPRVNKVSITSGANVEYYNTAISSLLANKQHSPQNISDRSLSDYRPSIYIWHNQ